MIRASLVVVAILLSGCMGRITLPPPQSSEVAKQASPEPKPRLWYVGLGLFDETWSEGDVAATATLLAQQAQGFQVVPIVFGYGASRRFTAPDRVNVDALMADIAHRARPDDVVLLYVSTHGAPGLLAREAHGRELEPATTEELREWLAPLGDRPTVLVLSACFSGSFIPGLRANNRIILAAARPDRTSFGCRAGAEHTVFGEALLNALTTPATSLRTIVQRVRAEVAQRERELAVAQPSEPQLFVGPAVTNLYEAPMF